MIWDGFCLLPQIKRRKYPPKKEKTSDILDGPIQSRKEPKGLVILSNEMKGLSILISLYILIYGSLRCTHYLWLLNMIVISILVEFVLKYQTSLLKKQQLIFYISPITGCTVTKDILNWVSGHHR